MPERIPTTERYEYVTVPSLASFAWMSYPNGAFLVLRQVMITASG